MPNNTTPTKSLATLKIDLDLIAEKMKVVEAENRKIMNGTKVDSSRLHLTFDM